MDSFQQYKVLVEEERKGQRKGVLSYEPKGKLAGVATPTCVSVWKLPGSSSCTGRAAVVPRLSLGPCAHTSRTHFDTAASAGFQHSVLRKRGRSSPYAPEQSLFGHA